LALPWGPDKAPVRGRADQPQIFGRVRRFAVIAVKVFSIPATLVYDGHRPHVAAGTPAMKYFHLALVAATVSAFAGLPAGAEDATKVNISRADCRALVRHVPDKGVAYQPGVDVRGKKVKPADVGGGSAWQVPESISIDIKIDIGEKFGIGTGGRFEGEASIAAVTVNTKTGEVLLDGKPVGDAATEAAIAKACRETYGK
jgi:hypothetical protein